MIDVNHQSRKHATLSASGSAKWLNCPASVKAEQAYPNTTSPFAQEGTLAHEVADLCLKNKVDAEHYLGKEITGQVIEQEMVRYVQDYLDYVRSYETGNSTLFTEERVDFSNVVPSGFGTMDSAVLDYNTGICHIFDLKYGKGVEVSAVENTQGQLYAIGLYNELAFMGDIKAFRIHIVQPRLYNFSHWDITVDDLIKFSEYVKDRANLALSPKAPYQAGEKQCQWCRAKADCKALAKFTENIITSQFDNLDDVNNIVDNKLTDKDKKLILDNKSLIESFLKSVESHVFERLKAGEKFQGYKLVEGRSIRKWKDDAETSLYAIIGNEAYTQKLITITEAQKKLGKDMVDQLAYKPQGKLTLAKESDKRKAVDVMNITEEFDKL